MQAATDVNAAGIGTSATPSAAKTVNNVTAISWGLNYVIISRALVFANRMWSVRPATDVHRVAMGLTLDVDVRYATAELAHSAGTATCTTVSASVGQA
jgi:hypothetical protein